MLAGELLDAAKRSRETFAWVLLGFVGASLFVELLALFVDRGFVVNAAGGHLSFVSPVHAGALALAVWLVSLGGEGVTRARLAVQVALALVAALLFVGVVAWLGGLTLEFGQTAGLKTVNSLRFLVDGGLLGAAGWFGLLVLQRMPAPVRPQPPPTWGRPQWDEQHWNQPQWGQEHWHQQQWSQQQANQSGWGPQQASRPGWGQPAWGQPGWGPPGWGRPHGSDRPDRDETQVFDAPPDPRPHPDPRAADGLSIFDPVTDDSTAAQWGSSGDDDTPEEDGDRRDWWPQQPS